MSSWPILPNAFAKVVDRLLNRRAMGNVRARYWLDLAHYGDNDGDNGNGPTTAIISQTLPHYVIRHLMKTCPTTVHHVEQIGRDKSSRSGDDKRPLARLGFLTLVVDSERHDATMTASTWWCKGTMA